MVAYIVFATENSKLQMDLMKVEQVKILNVYDIYIVTVSVLWSVAWEQDIKWIGKTEARNWDHGKGFTITKHF